MPIDYDKLKAWHFPEREQTYTTRDAILYALGIGLGHDPLDHGQLDFVYEKKHKVLPTIAVVLGTPGFWQKTPGTGIDALKAVHGEQSMVLHRPLPPSATVIAKSHVVAIVDKGKDRGALVCVERNLTDKATGDLLATIQAVTFCRADGGFGGRSDVLPEPHRLPDRPPDTVDLLQTVPQAALIYRLCGDDNPLHIDPDVARRAGFERPILHGLCTFGIAGHAVIKSFGDYHPDSLRTFRVRFSAPVYPGERVRTEMWRDGNIVSFRCFADERNVMILNSGRAELR